MTRAPVVLWELRGRAGKPITCVLLYKPGSYRVTIALAETTLHTDGFVRHEDALTTATFFLTDFTRSGWTEVYRADLLN